MGTFIKFCGVTNEADALTAIGLGVDAVGVIFAPSTRQVSLATAGDIVRRLPPEAMVVGVFRDESPIRVVEVANSLGLRGVQLHGHESVSDVSYVAERVPMVINALSATSPQLDQFEASGADLLLLDGPIPGSGVVFDWSLTSKVTDFGRLMLSGGLDPGNVGRAVELIRPFGVDVASGIEMAPGVKDPLKMKAFVDAVRQADELLSDLGDDGEGEEPFDWMRD